jgi:adenine-specific DNA-methyltransferase
MPDTFSLMLQPALDTMPTDIPDYIYHDLITYLGNKRGLMPFIAQGVAKVKALLGKDRVSFLDLFAGSGVVSRFMKAHAHTIVCNDLEDYACVVNRCYLSNRSEVDFETLQYHFDWLQKEITTHWTRGFIAELYAPRHDDAIQEGERVFYTRRNAEFIDTARQQIARLPIELQKFYLAPLIVKASVHNNTAGVFKGFYKNRQGLGAFGGEGANALARIKSDIVLHLPTLSTHDNDVLITQEDATCFGASHQETFDLVYLDPPYNQHPYGSNYFMLNLIANYVPPASYSKVSGIPNDWKRSPFNKPQSAKEALFTVIHTIKARFFLISYNSEGFIKKEEFISELQSLGKLTLLETQYNTYRGSRNLSSREQYVTEYLFLLQTHVSL